MAPIATKKSPRAVLFDLDGVIVDSEAVHHRAYELALAPFGVEHIPFEVYADVFSNRNQGLAYIERRHPGVEIRELRRRKDELYLDLLYREARLRPGAAEAVARLSERWPAALATGSSREAATFVLERFALRRFFAVVVGREDYTLDKPAPDAFLKASELLGEAPGNCVAIEDSHKGLRAAAAAGIPCIVVPNDYTRGGDFQGASGILSLMGDLTVDFVEGVFSPSPS